MASNSPKTAHLSSLELLDGPSAGINVGVIAATPGSEKLAFSPPLPWGQDEGQHELDDENCSLKRSDSSRARSLSASPQQPRRLTKSQSAEVLVDHSHMLHPELSRNQSTPAGKSNSLKRKEGIFGTLTRPLRRKSSKKRDPDNPLHYPKNSEALREFLKDPSIDVNGRDGSGVAPIHAIVTSKRRKSPELLLTLLSNSSVDVNIRTCDGETALHLAVMASDILMVKILLTFEVEVNAVNQMRRTAFDIALEKRQEAISALLVSVGGTTGDMVASSNLKLKLPPLLPFKDEPLGNDETDSAREKVDVPNGHGASNGVVNGGVCNGAHRGGQLSDFRERTFSSQSCEHATLRDMEDGKTLTTLYERLQQCVNVRLELSGSFSASTDEAIAITMQQKELLKYKKTARDTPSMFQVRNGSRILFLDGGGMRGLIQIEILRQLEKDTGRRIIELFDWIVGTSTGGILTLGLVYGKKTLSELRQLYFKIKDEVFANDRLGFAYNTEALENLLKKELGTDQIMSSVKFPRVLVTAVYKKTTMPELHFFNNCFGDEYSTYPIWKVARYTSAAPMLFSEFENYVDGGVLANNPSDYGLSAIQNYYRQIGQRLDIALVLSVGCGIYPEEELGKIDAQEFLFFGKHWFKIGHTLKKRAQNLIQLLTTALVESEAVARNTRSRLNELGVPYYRMSPHLDVVIPSGETDTNKLLDMVMKAKTVEAMSTQMDELVQMFYLVADMNKRERDRKKCERNLRFT